MLRYGPAALDELAGALPAADRARLASEVDALVQAGISAVCLGEPGYPGRLAATADGPVALFYRGAIELADRPALAVCGARDGWHRHAEVAAAAAKCAVANGFTVLTGGAKGLDAMAAATALAEDGATVTVLPDGIRNAGTGAPAGIEGRTLTLSQFPPSQGWSMDGAMERNTTVVGLAAGLVVIGAGSTGAVLDAGLRALDAGRPVFAVGETRGSQLLVDHGATAVRDHLELTWWLKRLAADLPGRAAPADRPATPMGWLHGTLARHSA